MYPISATLRTIEAVNRLCLFLSLRERIVCCIMFHYLTFTFSQKRVGTHKVRTHTVSGNLKLKLVFYMHIKPTIISRLYLSSPNHTRILFIRSGWTLVLFWLWSAYASPGNLLISTAVANQRQKTRQRSDEENASLTRQQDVINDPYEGHLESANPIREFKEKKRKRSTCAVSSHLFHWICRKRFRFVTNHPGLNLIVNALRNCWKRRLVKEETDWFITSLANMRGFLLNRAIARLKSRLESKTLNYANLSKYNR